METSKSNDIDFLIIDSAAGITVEEQNLFVLKNLLRYRNGVNGEQLAAVTGLLRRISDHSLYGKGNARELEAAKPSMPTPKESTASPSPLCRGVAASAICTSCPQS